MITGDDFKQWRRINNLNQSSASRALGVSRHAIRKWETDNPVLRDYIALACAAHSTGVEPIPADPEALTAWRTRMGISRRRAARELGCSAQAVVDWEEGKSRLRRYIPLACAAIEAKVEPLKSYSGSNADTPT